MIHCENIICIKISKNPLFHDRSKHIEIIYYIIKDMVHKEVVNLQQISIEE
jgi:hypothetical protein